MAYRVPVRRVFSVLTVVAMLAASLALLPVAPAAAVTGDLVISGVVDGPLTGGVPKAIELYAVNDIADLSIYGVGSANNGGGSDGEEFTFPPASATAGDFIYVASESTGFTDFFGFAPDFLSSAASINGDDAIELFMSGSVVDIFGDINVDGTGQPWEYLDGWAYRVDDTGQDGTTFVLGNWTFSGPNALDGETSNDTAAVPFPIGTYTTGPVDPFPLTVDCGDPLVTDEGVPVATQMSAIDGDDVVTSSNTVFDPVLDPGSFITGLSVSPGVGQPATLDIAIDDLVPVGVYEITVTFGNGSGEFESCMTTLTVESTTVVITLIHDVQGPGDASPLDGMDVTIEGIVVGDFQGSDALRGFFVQEEDADADADPATSEGIFVFDGSSPAVDVAEGDLVQVEGTVDEFFGLTEITSVDSVSVFSSGNPLPAATPVSLPWATDGDQEQYEGMLVQFVGDLVVSDTFNMGRFGDIVMSGGHALDIPTNVVNPGTDANALQDENDRNQIILDDNRSMQFVDPPVYFFDGTLRRGDTTTDLVGVINESFGYRVHPTGTVAFDRTMPREDPAPLAGNLRVASFNVLNYWTTIDDGANNARGADSLAELERQTAKTVAAILELDSPIIGLQELENNGPIAVGALVDALNDATAPDTWAAVPDPVYLGDPDGLQATNAIKVGIIYQTADAVPIGDPLVDEDPIFATDRPPVAQTFMVGDEVLTVISNHFKSKSPSGATGPDEDQGDGQGAYNFRRTQQAIALVDFVAEVQSISGDEDVLALGDFNSYRLEDPIGVLNGGLQNLVETYLPVDDQRSLVFFGQAGLLDYAFATPGLAAKATGADIWHSNADEPRALDYNDDVRDPGESSDSNLNPASLYQPNQWRASDHDAVIVGFDLPAVTLMDQKAAVLADVEALLGLADGRDAQRLSQAAEKIAASLDPIRWVDGNHLAPKIGMRVFDLEGQAIARLIRVGGDAGPGAQMAADTLVAIDRALAALAIEEAAEAGADTSQAEAHLAQGDDRVGDGKPVPATRAYKAAWKSATKALGDLDHRFSTFNASLNRFNAGDLIADLSAPGNAQAATVAEIIQRTAPDVLLINEFDFDGAGLAAQLFQENYLSISQNGADPIEYPYRFVAPSNTGVPSGFDLDNSGSVGGPGDAFGFGFFEGQFGMAVFSKYPIHMDEARTFQNFLWKDMPGALLPDDPDTADPADWYSPDELDVFRLSSKSHWDLPIVIGDETVHFLTSHPTPPVFDGPEDRNGTRNHDEIRFWADYIDPATSGYIYDDSGNFGGLEKNASFVIAGDQNSDPLDGDSIPGSIDQLLDHKLVNDKDTPSSLGGPEQAILQGGANDSHLSDPAFDTADFSDSAPGNLRVDYVLPRKTMKISDSGVFWPETADPLFPLVGTFPFPSSDHRLVWIDVETK